MRPVWWYLASTSNLSSASLLGRPRRDYLLLYADLIIWMNWLPAARMSISNLLAIASYKYSVFCDIQLEVEKGIQTAKIDSFERPRFPQLRRDGCLFTTEVKSKKQVVTPAK